MPSDTTIYKGKHIIFDLVENKPKTLVYDVLTKDEVIESGVTPHQIKLGQIKWYPNWRQYSFFPEPDTVFEKTCMTDIINFMNHLMQNRKEMRKGVKIETYA